MSFKLRKRTYNWRWLLLLPFQFAPFCTLGVAAQKLVTGIVCVLWIPVEAGFIDRVLECAAGTAAWGNTLPYMEVMLLLIVWKRLGYNLGRALTMKIETEAEYQLQKEIVEKCSRVPYRLLEDQTFQNLKYAVSESIEDTVWHMLQQTCNFLLYLIRIFGVCLLLFMENVWLGVLVPAIIVPLIYFSVRDEQQAQIELRDSKNFDRRIHYLAALLRGRQAAAERSLFSYSDYVGQQWDEQNESFQKVNYEGEKERERGIAAESVILGMICILIMVFRITLLAEGEISTGMFIALSKGVCDVTVFMHNGIGVRILPIEHCSDFLRNLTAFAAMPETEGTNTIPAEAGEDFEELEFKKVSFRYPRTAQYILKNLNMKLVKGRHYAFVGENGAGKTTIAKLLTGVYDSYEGSILINGKELRDYALERRKAMFSAVYQDSARYEETAAVNIRLGDIRHMEQSERMEQAAKQLGIYESIQALPEGFDTMLGKQAGDGTELSDGQWQRIIMARLFVNPAPFRILDEPAAALDPIAESRLYEQFGRISEGKTTISISHRLGSTKQADRIFVLKEGTVIEEGSHEELMSHKGLYAQMYESQKRWYL